jgi:hypothetical protein
MILEWIEYLRTPASNEARKFGLVRESIALRARAQRQHKSWQSHLQNCHRVVDGFVADHTSARSVMILGSGHLLDISPRVFENGQLENIYLVDLVHPLEIRKRFQADLRVELIEQDLSGSLGASRLDLDNLRPAQLPMADLVISANLMSQLPLPWTARSAEISDEDRVGVETSLSRAHWEFLKSQADRGSSVLFWTDFEKKFFDEKQELVHLESSLGSFTFPDKIEKWDWDIAPIPEISNRLGLQMRVACGRVERP